MITCTNLVQNTDGTDDADSAVASATYTAGRLYLLTLCSRADAVQPTISSIGVPASSGMVWTIIGTGNTFDASGSRRTLFLYRAMPSSTQSGGLTVTWGGTQTAKAWNIDEIDGIDTGGTQGSAAIVQQVPGAGASVTSLSITLGAFSGAGNATYGAFGNAGEGALTAGTGFTRFGNQQVAGEAGVGTEFRSDNDTSVDMSNGTMDIGGIAIELKAAPTTSIKNMIGVAQASIKKAESVALASIKKVSGVANS